MKIYRMRLIDFWGFWLNAPPQLINKISVWFRLNMCPNHSICNEILLSIPFWQAYLRSNAMIFNCFFMSYSFFCNISDKLARNAIKIERLSVYIAKAAQFKTNRQFRLFNQKKIHIIQGHFKEPICSREMSMKLHNIFPKLLWNWGTGIVSYEWIGTWVNKMMMFLIIIGNGLSWSISRQWSYWAIQLILLRMTNSNKRSCIFKTFPWNSRIINFRT